MASEPTRKRTYEVGNRNGQVQHCYLGGGDPLVNIIDNGNMIVGGFHDEELARRVVELLNASALSTEAEPSEDTGLLDWLDRATYAERHSVVLAMNQDREPVRVAIAAARVRSRFTP